MARNARAGFDVRAEGLQRPDTPRLLVYGSSETYSWSTKACELLRLGDGGLRRVRVDADYRVDIAALRAAIAEDRAARSSRRIDPLTHTRLTMRLETLLVHAGRAPDPTTGAVSPPLHLSTNFARDPDGGLPHGFLYARSENPTRVALERALAPLEGGAVAFAFASGMAATTALFQSLRTGDHVIAPNDAYYGTAKVLREVFGRWGLSSSFVDMTDPAAVERAVTPRTRVVWIETPSNPALAVTDIAAVCRVARAAGAVSVCDNTWATPLLQRPLELGADVAMHATTKYLGGHGDVTGGALVLREDGEIAAMLRTVQTVGGAVPSPFDCWLVHRGIRTLAYRMRGHCDNAERLAAFLDGHAAVEVVHYPGLAGDPGHAVSGRQMRRYGGMLSVQIRGGAEAALAVVSRVRLFTRATSLGGPESLIEHRASSEGPGSRTPPGLLRMSVGLEHPDDLIEDLDQALRRSP